MCDHPARMLALLGLVLTLSLTGCKAPKPVPAVTIVPASKAGFDYYAKAKAVWAQVRARDPHGKPLQLAMDEVMKRLQHALDNDPTCPLFLSKSGELWLSLGTGYHDRADKQFAAAHKVCEDWVPAWLGWAELALKRGDFAGLDRALHGAESAIRNLQNPLAPVKPFNALEAMGLVNAKPMKDTGKAAIQRMLIAWIHDGLQWSITNEQLVNPVAAPELVDAGAVLNRLRARVALLRAIGLEQRGGTAAQVTQAIESALRLDPDYFNARMAMAKSLRLQNRYREAAARVRPFVDSNNPMLRNNRDLLSEVASIYTDLYRIDAQIGWFDLAEGYFVRLHQLHPNHPPSLIKRAELLIHINHGSADGKRKALKGAKFLIDEAAKRGGDDASLNRIRKSLKAVQATLPKVSEPAKTGPTESGPSKSSKPKSSKPKLSPAKGSKP